MKTSYPGMFFSVSGGSLSVSSSITVSFTALIKAFEKCCPWSLAPPRRTLNGGLPNLLVRGTRFGNIHAALGSMWTLRTAATITASPSSIWPAKDWAVSPKPDSVNVAAVLSVEALPVESEGWGARGSASVEALPVESEGGGARGNAGKEALPVKSEEGGGEENPE